MREAARAALKEAEDRVEAIEKGIEAEVAAPYPGQPVIGIPAARAGRLRMRWHPGTWYVPVGLLRARHPAVWDECAKQGKAGGSCTSWAGAARSSATESASAGRAAGSRWSTTTSPAAPTCSRCATARRTRRDPAPAGVRVHAGAGTECPEAELALPEAGAGGMSGRREGHALAGPRIPCGTEPGYRLRLRQRRCPASPAGRLLMPRATATARRAAGKCQHRLDMSES